MSSLCPEMSAGPRLSQALWQLPFHLASLVFNWPHYVINLANLPLTLEAQLGTLADHKPSQSHSITESTISAFRPAITFHWVVFHFTAEMPVCLH